MLEVTRAEYVDGYRIRVSLNNGHSGIVDLTDTLWGPAFEPLRDVEKFKRVSLSKELHTVCWDNDVDLAPEFLDARMLSDGAGAHLQGGA